MGRIACVVKNVKRLATTSACIYVHFTYKKTMCVHIQAMNTEKDLESMYIHKSNHINICVHVYIYMHACIYMHTYTYIHKHVRHAKDTHVDNVGQVAYLSRTFLICEPSFLIYELNVACIMSEYSFCA